MNKEKILSSSLFICIGITILATWFKLMHKPGADTLFLVSLVAGIIFIINAVMEVSRSERIERSEKIMWTIGFFF